VRWIGSLFALAALLFALLNLRHLLRAIRERRLRAHPERDPREAASLWYGRMVSRMARVGWRKSPSQTPVDFVAAIQEPALQEKVATFTRAYESARFGKSTDDAQTLPDLYKDIEVAQQK
jgi:hypothetical protein